MPPRYLRRRYSTRLKPCQERTVSACDTVPAAGCCGVIPCKLCLEWEVYGEDIVYGSADHTTDSWIGEVSAFEFIAYWEFDYESQECHFVVALNGVEVYRSGCYEGASCRDPSGSALVEVDYVVGTIRWSVYEPRELKLISDPDTGCRDFFCGSCRCTCRCLCVRIFEYDGTLLTGEICDSAYDCDAPVWQGTIGYYNLSLALGRDEYGECVVTPTVNGEEYDPVSAGGCGDLAAAFDTYDGASIFVTCKQCTCDVVDETCCPDRTDWPSRLTVEISDPSPEGCYNLTGVLNEIDPVAHSYGGELTGTCSWCSQTFDIRFTVILTCNAISGWLLDFGTGSPADDCGRVPPDTVLTQLSCDPILLSGDIDCFTCALMNCMTPDPPNPPMPRPHDPFCLSAIVYESP